MLPLPRLQFKINVLFSIFSFDLYIYINNSSSNVFLPTKLFPYNNKLGKLSLSYKSLNFCNII